MRFASTSAFQDRRTLSDVSLSPSNDTSKSLTAIDESFTDGEEDLSVLAEEPKKQSLKAGPDDIDSVDEDCTQGAKSVLAATTRTGKNRVLLMEISDSCLSLPAAGRASKVRAADRIARQSVGDQASDGPAGFDEDTIEDSSTQASGVGRVRSVSRLCAFILSRASF